MPTERTKPTIYDVARRAGVAISTVSRVLNESRDVSDATRARVLEAIHELQFRPDRTAKNLAQKRLRILAVAVPTVLTPFHNELLKGVRTELHDSTIDLLLCDLGSYSPRETLLDFLGRGSVDGLLLVGVPVDEALTQELKALQAPVVLVGNHHSDFDCFYWDERGGAYRAVRHLTEQRHKRIGMIRSHTESYIQQERIEGYRQALEEAGIPFDETRIVSGQTEKHGGFSEETGQEAMEILLAQTPRVSAVFASSDVQAIGAWSLMAERGIGVPEEVALVGYDDIKTSHYLGLSSIDQQVQDIGRSATQLLLQRVIEETEGDFVDVLTTPRLVVRRSSDLKV